MALSRRRVQIFALVLPLVLVAVLIHDHRGEAQFGFGWCSDN